MAFIVNYIKMYLLKNLIFLYNKKKLFNKKPVFVHCYNYKILNTV